jgi:hypothetical protein
MRCVHFYDYFAGNVKNLTQFDKNYSHYQIDLLKLNFFKAPILFNSKHSSHI